MAKRVTSDDGPRRAVLCKTCPFRRNAPKAGERGGSVPMGDINHMREAVHAITEGRKVMQCHMTEGVEPRACAGFLSVVGYESIGVRIGVAFDHLCEEDVGRPIEGLYGSLAEMLREADHLDILP